MTSSPLFTITPHVLTALARSLERQAMMVCAPITASAFAVSYPMPAFPPVTTATRRLRSTTGKERFAPIIKEAGLIIGVAGN